jgi:NADH:ubiquinone oxidoreductase subunit F (NADH-binding)
MALAALASRANHAYVYVRSEYPAARHSLLEAVEQAQSAGHLGANVHGSGIDFDIEVFEGAGSYVAGEETSLIHSIEGLRGAVSARPPFPTESGLLDRPTVVNNVETLAAVPWICARGGDAYARLGRGSSSGTELVCINERFERAGVYEVELGVTMREIVEPLGGGLRDGHSLRALQVGGPLGGFLAPDQLDTPFTFEGLARAGASLGHGSVIAIDERVSGVELLRHMWRFARSESCGACFPCRIGTQRGLELADTIAEQGPDPEQTQIQDQILETMGASLCAFGTSVPLAVRGIMRVYADELGAPRA